MFTARQFERKKGARKFLHALITTSIPAITTVVCMNIIKANPMISDDIKLVKNIFGPDVGTIKGKITRLRLVPVV